MMDAIESIQKLIDEYNKLVDELARRDEQVADLEKSLHDQIVEDYEKLVKRDDLIKRLVEDGERLCDIADNFGYDAVAVLKHRKLMKELEDA